MTILILLRKNNFLSSFPYCLWVQKTLQRIRSIPREWSLDACSRYCKNKVKKDDKTVLGKSFQT